MNERFEVELEPTPRRGHRFGHRPGHRVGDRVGPPSGEYVAPPAPRDDLLLPGGATPEAPYVGDGPPAGDDRSRLIGVGVAGGLALLVVGFVLGRAGGDGGADAEVSAPPASATVAAAEPAPATVVATLPRPRPTTTTQVPIESFGLGGPLLPAPTGLELVGTTTSGDLVEIVLDTGIVTVTDLPLRRSGPDAGFEQQPYAIPLEDETIVGFRDGSRILSVPRGGVPEPASFVFREGYVLFPSHDPSAFWVVRYTTGNLFALELVDADGFALREGVQIDGWFPAQADGRGGMLVAATGGTYVADADGTHRITEGEPIAIGPNHVIVLRCDDVLACGTFLVDRATGEDTLLTIDGLGIASRYFYLGYAATISPDGASAVLGLQTPQRSGLAVVDLATGEPTWVGSPANELSVVWTDDSRFALLIEGSSLTYFDRATGETGQVSSDLPQLLSIERRRPSA